MKVLQILSCLLLIAAISYADDEEYGKEFDEIAAKCGEEQGLSKEQVDEIPRMICESEDLDKPRKCQLSCTYDKLGVVKDGQLLADEFKEKLLKHIKESDEKDEVKGIVDKCKDKISGMSDDCEMAYEFTKCLMEGSKLCRKMPEENN